MSIIISNVVVHELIKDAKRELDKSSQRIQKTALNSKETSVINLVERINEVYGDKENHCEYGNFLDNDRQGRFPKSYDKYATNTNNTSSHFIDLTTTFMQELIEQASKTDWATGGYIICAEYIYLQQEFLTIAMIKKNNEIRFDENLSPETIVAINLKKLHQGVRINKNKFLTRNQEDSADHNYLSFIGESADGVASYFINAVGCAKGLTSRKATESVYKFVSNKFSENEILKNETLKAKHSITNLLEKKIQNNSPVTISDIVAVLQSEFSSKFNNPKEMENFFGSFAFEMNNETNRIPLSFNAHQLTVRNRKQITYKSEHLSLRIEAGIIDKNNSSSNIYWDVSANTLTIKIDASLKNELEQKLNG